MSDDQIPVLVVLDRHKSTAMVILERVDATLSPLVDDDVILRTDTAAVYCAFCKKTGVEYEVIKSKDLRDKGAFHIQNVNAFDSRLKG